MKTFTINGRTYRAREFDFNMVCDMEDMGIAMGDFKNKQTASMRAYFALSANTTLEIAGIEMQSHVINGGDFTELAEAMGDAIGKSDFFQAIFKNAKEENPEMETEESKTVKKTKAKA